MEEPILHRLRIFSFIILIFLISFADIGYAASASPSKVEDDTLRISDVGVSPANSLMPKTFARQAALMNCYRYLNEAIYGVEVINIPNSSIIKTHQVCDLEKMDSLKIESIKFIQDGACEAIISVKLSEARSKLEYELTNK